MKTADYWLALGSSSMSQAKQDDSVVTFQQEIIAGIVQIAMGPNQQLLKRDLQIEIYTSPDQNSKFQLLKQINMNLAIFVDKGKIDDVITFQDIGVMFVFDMEVT